MFVSYVFFLFACFFKYLNVFCSLIRQFWNPTVLSACPDINWKYNETEMFRIIFTTQVLTQLYFKGSLADFPKIWTSKDLQERKPDLNVSLFLSSNL